MKQIGAGLVMLSLAAFVGCSGTSSTSSSPGGATGGSPKASSDGSGKATHADTKATHSGATHAATEKEPIVGVAEGKFELKPPKTTQDIKQGEAKSIEIDIDRGKNYEGGDVTLTFHGPDGKELPKGVTVKPEKPIIRAEDKKGIKVEVQAAADAAVGKHDVQIVGKPEKGAEGKATMTIEVKAK